MDNIVHLCNPVILILNNSCFLLALQKNSQYNQNQNLYLIQMDGKLQMKERENKV